MHTPDPIQVASGYAADHPQQSRGDIETIMHVIDDNNLPPAS